MGSVPIYRRSRRRGHRDRVCAVRLLSACARELRLARACVDLALAWRLRLAWLSLGYAAVGWPLQGFAPIGGVFALSFLTVTLGGMLALAATRAPRRVHWLAALLAVLGAGEALRHVEWSSPRAAPLTVALLQGNIEQSLKFDPERYERTLETYARLAEDARARLITFPQTAVPRFLDPVDRPPMRGLEAVAQRNG